MPNTNPPDLTVRLLGLDLFVRFEDPKSWSDAGMGRFDPHLSEILINQKMESGAQRNTLLHEMTHAILNHAGLMALYEDEVLVSTMAAAFTDFLQSNPEVVEAFMTKKPLSEVRQGGW